MSKNIDAPVTGLTTGDHKRKELLPSDRSSFYSFMIIQAPVRLAYLRPYVPVSSYLQCSY